MHYERLISSVWYRIDILPIFSIHVARRLGFISRWGALAGRYAALCPPGWPWTHHRMPFHSPTHGKFHSIAWHFHLDSQMTLHFLIHLTRWRRKMPNSSHKKTQQNTDIYNLPVFRLCRPFRPMWSHVSHCNNVRTRVCAGTIMSRLFV